MAIFFAGGDPDELENLLPHREGPLGDTVGEKMLAAMASIDWTYRGGDRDDASRWPPGDGRRCRSSGSIQSLIGIAGIATFIYQDHPRSIELLDKNLRVRARGRLAARRLVGQPLARRRAVAAGDLAGFDRSVRDVDERVPDVGHGAGAGTRYASDFSAPPWPRPATSRVRRRRSARHPRTPARSRRAIACTSAGGRSSNIAEGSYEDAIATADTILARYPEMVSFAFVRSRCYKARSLAALGRLERRDGGRSRGARDHASRIARRPARGGVARGGGD